MKVALVHHYLLNMRGGERVLEMFCEIFPQADIFTLVYNESVISDKIKGHNINTSFLQKLPFAKTKWRYYLPLFPFASEQLDLRNYDIVISSDSACIKGVITRSDTLHICYCHTPMRYAWDLYFDYLDELPKAGKEIAHLIMHYIRQFDFRAAQQVDYFIANSRNTARRIKKYYRRDSQIIYPPVDTDFFKIDTKQATDNFYLYVGELVPYKRANLIVKSFNELNRPLKVIGNGPQFQHLKKIARDNIELLGRQPRQVVKHYFQRCKAFVFAAEEDFGITPLEAQACGKPVIAFKKGGAVETIINGKTGIFFDHQTVDSLISAVEKYETLTFDPKICRDNATRFSGTIFRKRIKNFVIKKYNNLKM